MAIELRQPTPDERADVSRTAFNGFGAVRAGDDMVDGPSRCEWDRTFVCFDEVAGSPTPVATAGAHSFQLTLPGGTQVGAGGLAEVAVLPTHRRRGLLTRLMQAHFDDCIDRGEACSMLTASETGIYDRFGYGWALHQTSLRIPTARGAYRADLPDSAAGRSEGSSVRQVMSDIEATVAPIYEAMRLGRNGALDRPSMELDGGESQSWWHSVLHPVENWKGGGKLFCAVFSDAEGTDQGYVLYKIAEISGDGHLQMVLTINELVALTDEADAALWRHCLDRDLIERVLYPLAPVDGPIRWRLAEPRWLRADSCDDALWLRPLDVEALLGARTWSASGELTIEVVDTFLPEVGGRFTIEAEQQGSVNRSTRPVDLTMGIDVLGSLAVGGMSAVALHRAGRIEGTAEAASMAEAMFTTTPAPWMITRF